MNKNKKIFIITITFLMLIGLTTITATDTNDTTTITETTTIDTPTTETNTNNYDTTSTNEASPTQTDDIQENSDSKESLNDKSREKTQNLKASRTETVSTFDELNSVLRNYQYDTVTINIANNINLKNFIQVNSVITNLTINGNGHTINGQNKYYFLSITHNNLINNLTITNCTNRDGGAIAIHHGNLTVININFTQNNALVGGAINGWESNIIINNSNFIQNNVDGGGGAIESDGNLTIHNSNFTQNTGGAIFGRSGNIIVINSTFTYNTANGMYVTSGGAISGDWYTNVIVNNSNFIQNTAIHDGGAISISTDSALTVTNSYFTENTANYNGGAIDSGGNLTIYNTTLNNNTANESGGAIQQSNQFYGPIKMTIKNSTLNNNNANIGGAIHNEYGNLTILNSTLNNNNALGTNGLNGGGAIYNDNNGNLTIHNTTLNNNTANNRGGAIYSNEKLYITNSTLNNNTANNEGGAIYNTYRNITITNSTLNNNNANNTGGAIHNDNSGNLTIHNTTLNNNNANNEGGAIYSIGNLMIINNKITSNHAINGGAIVSRTQNLTIYNSTLNNNTANNEGGAIYAWYNITLQNSILTNNYVNNTSGHVINFNITNSIITITDNIFINNTDNTRDMLFSDTKRYADVDIHGNTYIDNFLEDSIVEPNIAIVTTTESTSYNYYIDVNLRSIYNDTVRNGTLKVYVNGNLTDTTEVINGRARIFFNNNDLTKRENNITLEYITLSKHYQNTSTTFTIKKEINTTLTIQAPSTMNAGETALINFTLTDNDNNPLSGETIHVLVDEEQVATITTDSNGIASYTFNAFGDEIVRIEATHHTSSDSPYLSAIDAVAEIDVNKIEPEIVIAPGNIIPLVESNITIHLFDPDGNPIKNKTLTVNITEEGKLNITGTVTTDENGIAIFNFTPVDEGTLNINVTSPSDDIYHYASETIQVNPILITTNLILTATPTTINKTNIISVEVLANGALISGTVELDIDGEIHTLPINNGRGTYHDYKSETAGEKLVTAKFTSTTPGYTNATTTEEFNVGKLPTRVTIEAINRTAGNLTLKILVFPENNTGSIVNGGNIVIESIDGEKRIVIYNNTLVNGELIYLTDVNETGWYEFATEYHGNDYFLGEVNNTGSLEVTLVSTDLITFDKNALVGDTITLNATVTDVDGKPVNEGNVTFHVDGIPLYHADGTPVEAKLENGIATTEYTLPTTYTKGKYLITANYPGNNKYNTSSGESELSIDLHDTIIDVIPVNNTKGNTTIEVTLNSTTDNKPIPNAPIIVKDENGTIIGEGITDENGTAIIPIDIPVGENNITITYPGDEIHSPQEETTTINVTPRESQTTGTVNNNTVGNVTIDVQVVDPETGEPVTGPVKIIIDDEVVGTGDLDDEGKATIPTDIDKKGNYTIVVEYKGNENYKGSNDTLKDVPIKGKDVDMDIVIDNPIVGNTTVNVTLTDPETGEPIPNATVIVTLPNGTNVTETTDENGTAIIPIDLPSGDNNITITYPGDDEHEAQQENRTVKVKSYSIVTVEPVEGIALDNVTFTANVRDYQDKPVTGGYVQFNVGGKTLKDENGQNIRVLVENGIAKLSYQAESGWIIDTHPDLKVQAVYTGTSIVLANRSDTSKVTIYKRNATVEVSAPDDYVNGTLHIDAVVKDQNGSFINDGVLVFKLNGLSLKDENNKGIIAQVVNGKVHLDVKLPFAYSAKTYNLTAVYSNKIYNKATGINTTTLKAIPTYVNATVTIKDQFSKPVVTGQIYNKFNDAILEGTAIINIKFDGISYAKKVKVENGTFSETLEGISIYKPGTHTVEIAAGANSHYDAVRKTITTKATPKYNVTTEFISITRNKTTTRVQARIVDDMNKNVQRNLSITIKLNGKSFLINKTVTNGNVDVLFDTSALSNRNYSLELVSGANTYYNAGKATAELPKY